MCPFSHLECARRHCPHEGRLIGRVVSFTVTFSSASCARPTPSDDCEQLAGVCALRVRLWFCCALCVVCCVLKVAHCVFHRCYTWRDHIFWHWKHELRGKVLLTSVNPSAHRDGGSVCLEAGGLSNFQFFCCRPSHTTVPVLLPVVRQEKPRSKYAFRPCRSLGTAFCSWT